MATIVDQGSFIKDVTVNGSSKKFLLASNGYIDIWWWGVFGGATVELELSPDGTNWFPIPDFQKTDKAAVLSHKISKCYGRWTVSNAGGTTNVSATFTT